MRHVFRVLTLSASALLLAACAADVNMAAMQDATVDASCGQCQFGLSGSGCDLAVRVDDAAYYVDGSSIDDHGDAHGDDGLCNAVRKARVSGQVVDGRFVATDFELLPDTPE